MKAYSKLLIISLLLTSNISSAGTTKKVIGTELMIHGIGTAIAIQMYQECNTASAPIWDTPPETRNSHICVDLIKQLGTLTELNIFKKYDAEATSNLRKLKNNLKIERVAAGGPPEPPEGCDAHHIVPHREGRAWAKDIANASRKILSDCNIDINSIENGVYLPNGKAENTECEGSHHPSLHTKEYYLTTSNMLKQAKSNGGCDAVKETLNAIKQSLIRGGL